MQQSALNPVGPQAAAIEQLWWLIFWISAAVFVAVVGLLARAVWRTSEHTASDRALTRWVMGGVATTILVLFVWLIASVRVGRALASPQRSGAVTINVTGRQWWWQLEYVDSVPANRFRTANEIHVPVGRPIVLNVTSRDVIHSLWVPNLHGKRDLIPGYITSFWFQSDVAGVFRGQCAEFCGFQHAHMAVFVRSESEEQFNTWLTGQRQPSVEPVSPAARQGRDVFLRTTCPQCHAIRGTLAGATFGPDLTHLASRATIGAGTLPNTPDNLRRWIANSHAVKPGNKMPPHDLSDGDLQALVDYLGSLK